MKILFFSTDFKPRSGGIAELSYRICRELGARAHKVTVLTQGWPNTAEEEIMDTITVRRVLDATPRGKWRWQRLIRRQLWAWRAAAPIAEHLRELQPDVVFAGNYNSLWASVLPRCKRPYFVFLHGEDVAAALATKVPLRKRRMRNTLKGATWTFSNSTYSLRLIEKLLEQPLSNASAVGCGFPVENIVVEADQQAARRELGWDDQGPVLLTVARITLRKGIDTTIQALPHVLKEFPDCRYVVAGDGSDRKNLECLTRQLRLDNHVVFAGYLSEEDKRNAYLASDLYVMPSRPGQDGEVEGFGISFLEANAHGLAVVGSTAGGIPDAVGHDVNGLLVDPHDPAALAEAVITILRDPDRRRRMALAGQRRIREKFNWPQIVDVIEEKLISAVGNTAPQPG